MPSYIETLERVVIRLSNEVDDERIRVAELEKEKKILYIEAQIDGVELVADWIDGYYAPCVVAVVDELWKELNKLEQGK
jgi:hypothetical protein